MYDQTQPKKQDLARDCWPHVTKRLFRMLEHHSRLALLKCLLLDVAQPMRCLCGAKDCRGIIGGSQEVSVAR